MLGSVELESLPRTLPVEGVQIPCKILLTRPAMQSIAIVDSAAPACIGTLVTNTARPWRGSTAWGLQGYSPRHRAFPPV